MSRYPDPKVKFKGIVLKFKMKPRIAAAAVIAVIKTARHSVYVGIVQSCRAVTVAVFKVDF